MAFRAPTAAEPGLIAAHRAWRLVQVAVVQQLVVQQPAPLAERVLAMQLAAPAEPRCLAAPCMTTVAVTWHLAAQLAEQLAAPAARPLGVEQRAAALAGQRRVAAPSWSAAGLPDRQRPAAAPQGALVGLRAQLLRCSQSQLSHLAQQPAALEEQLRAVKRRAAALAELRCTAAPPATMLLWRFARLCCAHGACLLHLAARLAQRPVALAGRLRAATRRAAARAGQRRLAPMTALSRTARLCCGRGGSLCLPTRPWSSKPTATGGRAG